MLQCLLIYAQDLSVTVFVDLCSEIFYLSEVWARGLLNLGNKAFGP